MDPKGKILLKEDLDKFLNILSGYGHVYGPVKNKVDKTVRFEKISSAKQLCLDTHSWFPAKRTFFPQKHVLFTYVNGKLDKHHQAKQTVLFGLRNCDINGFDINDRLFLGLDHKDPVYKERREKTLLVGLYCFNEMDNYCFCSSIDLKECHDIMLYDRGKYYHVKARTPNGKKYVDMLKQEEEFMPEATKCSRKLSANTLKEIAKYFMSNEWKKGSDACLSCGHCTNLCPTCLCFTVNDWTGLDGKGERLAEWDSCQYKDFTRVAGGHIFREARVDRFKHRIYHKLQYFKDEFGRYMCTGCGRCMRGCPAKIDWNKIVNEIK